MKNHILIILGNINMYTYNPSFRLGLAISVMPFPFNSWFTGVLLLNYKSFGL